MTIWSIETRTRQPWRSEPPAGYGTSGWSPWRSLETVYRREKDARVILDSLKKDATDQQYRLRPLKLCDKL